jgi:hypothetical protein
MIAIDAVIHPTAKVGADVEIGALTRVAEGATIGDRVLIGRRCLIGPGSTIIADAVIGERNQGYLYCIVPGGPYPLEAYYLRDGRLWYAIGCESHPLDEFFAQWEDIATKHGYAEAPISVVFVQAARMLVRPEGVAGAV